MPLFFYPHPSSENSACDSITYINGKDFDLHNGFIKSYQQGTLDLKIDFRHSSDVYHQLQALNHVFVYLTYPSYCNFKVDVLSE